MSEDKNEGGSIIPGTIGGGLGLGASKLVSNHVQGNGYRAALNSAEGATKGFTDSLNKVLDHADNGALRNQRELLSTLKTHMTEEGAKNVQAIRFRATKKGGEFVMHLKDADGVLHAFGGIKKLPDGITAGVTLREEGAIKNLLVGEKAVAAEIAKKAENGLIKAVRGKAEWFSGLKNAGWGGKSLIIGSAVACAAVGAMALNAMFGGSGKHTSRVSDERANEPTAGAARA